MEVRMTALDSVIASPRLVEIDRVQSTTLQNLNITVLGR